MTVGRSDAELFDQPQRAGRRQMPTLLVQGAHLDCGNEFAIPLQLLLGQRARRAAIRSAQSFRSRARSQRPVERFRIAGVIVICLFTAAVFLPGHQSTSAGFIIHQSDDVVPGWRLASLGWLGPLGLCFAWFANVPLIICFVKMLRGKSPKQPIAVITACLALSVLLPQRIWQPADGWHTGHLYGPAVWLWLSCFGVIVLASMLTERHELKVRASNAV